MPIGLEPTGVVAVRVPPTAELGVEFIQFALLFGVQFGFYGRRRPVQSFLRNTTVPCAPSRIDVPRHFSRIQWVQ